MPLPSLKYPLFAPPGTSLQVGYRGGVLSGPRLHHTTQPKLWLTAGLNILIGVSMCVLGEVEGGALILLITNKAISGMD